VGGGLDAAMIVKLANERPRFLRALQTQGEGVCRFPDRLE
jgi:hypothetical protein